MGASSVDGSGQGSSNKLGVKELSILANGPTICIASTALATEEVLTSPPGGDSQAEVVFPEVLPGGTENYIVLLTPLNVSSCYVTDMDEDDDGNFSGFSIHAEGPGTIMYLVVKKGIKPAV